MFDEMYESEAFYNLIMKKRDDLLITAYNERYKIYITKSDVDGM